MSTAAFNLINEFDKLTVEEKEYVKELIDKITIDARREEIRKNAKISRKEAADGKLKFGTAKDVLKALNAD